MLQFMIGLLIDTSIDHPLIALSTGEAIAPTERLSETLLPSIESLLKKNALSFSNLTYIAVGCGPGAFTGTRLGVMTAKTLSYATSLPLVGFCSLERLVPLEEGPFTALIAAHSRGHYALDGEYKEGLYRFKTPYMLDADEPLPLHQCITEPSTWSHIAARAEERFEAGEATSPFTLDIDYLYTP